MINEDHEIEIEPEILPIILIDNNSPNGFYDKEIEKILNTTIQELNKNCMYKGKDNRIEWNRTRIDINFKNISNVCFLDSSNKNWKIICDSCKNIIQNNLEPFNKTNVEYYTEIVNMKKEIEKLKIELDTVDPMLIKFEDIDVYNNI